MTRRLRGTLGIALTVLLRSQSPAAACTARCRNQLVHDGRRLPFVADRTRTRRVVWIYA